MERVDDVIEELDVIIERLEHDYEYNPMRILGMKATFELMSSIYTALLTIGFALTEKIINKSNED